MAIVLYYPEIRNRQTIRISNHEDAPDSNVIHRDRPLAQALIGATIDEMVELDVSGKTIRMLVERIYPYVEAAGRRLQQSLSDPTWRSRLVVAHPRGILNRAFACKSVTSWYA
jgi:hypothetical protein